MGKSRGIRRGVLSVLLTLSLSAFASYRIVHYKCAGEALLRRANVMRFTSSGGESGFTLQLDKRHYQLTAWGCEGQKVVAAGQAEGKGRQIILRRANGPDIRLGITKSYGWHSTELFWVDAPRRPHFIQD